MRVKVAVIVVTIALLALAKWVELTFELPMWQMLAVYLVPYLLVGYGVLREAAQGVARGDVMNEHFLMTVATVGALMIGSLPGAEPEMTEAVAVMLFFYVGEMFEEYAEGQSERSIQHLLALRPEVARVVRDGKAVAVSPREVTLGELMEVRPGERIALDGVVESGSTSIDAVALTGESVPREVGEGEPVSSGCVNLTGVIRIRVSKTYCESTVNKIIEMVESAEERKSHSETFIARFARVYTPVVVVAAVLLALVPPLISGDFAGTFAQWLYRALMFLVISCPCALVISVPLTFFGGIGSASRNGILIKGGNYLDALAKVSTVVMDKTGTLTKGRFEVVAVHPERCDERRLLHLAAHVEHYTTHPIGAALRAAFPDEATDGCDVSGVTEIAGRGIKARVGREDVCVGNEKLMAEEGVSFETCRHKHTGAVIHVAIDGVYAGHVEISDSVKENSAEAVRALRREGVDEVVMLTGDREEVAREVAREIGIDRFYAELMPSDKVSHVEQMMAKEHERSRKLAFVGDGVNDAPVIARADVGVAMGALGSDAAIEAADVVLMDDNPLKIVDAVRVARRTVGIAWQNVWFAIGVKLAVLALAAAGVATMWMAVFADVGVTVLAVLNAMRALRRAS